MGSDHYLITAIIQVKLKSLGKKRTNQALDLDMLKIEDVQRKFRLELKSRFSLLEEGTSTTEMEVDEEWKSIKDTVRNTAKQVIGVRRGSIKEKWITIFITTSSL